MNNSADTCPLYDIRPGSMARSPIKEDIDCPEGSEVTSAINTAKKGQEDHLRTREFGPGLAVSLCAPD